MADRRTPSGRREPRDRRPPPRRRRGKQRRFPPFALAIVAIAVVVLAIALATRGGDDSTTAKATADPVVPKIDTTATTASAQELGPRDQELVNIGGTGVSVHKAGGNRKAVALTFDDGPSEYTPQVLGILKRENVPATFFVIGENIKDHQSELQQVVADGNQVGVHTWTHADLTKVNAAKLKEEVDTTANAILSTTGVASRLFRAPYGAVNPAVIAQSEKSKLLSVLWDVDTSDWTRPSADQITQSVLSQVTPGAIILMHDGGGDRTTTVEALPKIIKGLKAQGYSFATVGDLVVSDPPGPEDVSVDGKGVSE